MAAASSDQGFYLDGQDSSLSEQEFYLDTTQRDKVYASSIEVGATLSQRVKVHASAIEVGYIVSQRAKAYSEIIEVGWVEVANTGPAVQIIY